MAARTRAHDWAATPLGQIDGWPQSLKALVDLMLATSQLATLAIGPERIFLYNDEASRRYGGHHPAVLGQPLARAFPHEFEKVAPFYERVFAGEGVHVPAQPLDLAGTGLPEVFDAYLAPVRDSDGRVIAAYMTGFAIGDRQRAETRLRESEARLRSALSISTVGVVFWGGNDTLVDANEAFLRMTGLARPDALGKNWRQLTPPEFLQRSVEFAAEVEATGQGAPYERQCFHSDGTRWWGLFAARKLGDGFVEFVLDVSARREAETALLETGERLRQFGEASLDVLWIRDVETLQWTYLTPAFEAIYGMSREEALAGDNYRRWQDLIVPEDRARAMASISRVADGERVTFEYRIRRPLDGQVRWLRDTDFPMPDEAGRVVQIGGVGHDITELKAMQAALESEKERFRTLTEGIPQLVWRADAAGAWTWAGPQWAAFTGQAPIESLGEGWLDAVNPDDHGTVGAAWDGARADGSLLGDWRLRRAGDATWRWFQNCAVAVRDPAGQVVEWIGTSTDIDDQVQAREALAREQQKLEDRVAERTSELMQAMASLHQEMQEREQAEDRLRHSEKLKAIGQLTGGIAHDFNNMLQAITSGLSMIRYRAQQGRAAEIPDYVERAEKSAKRAATLTHRLLAFGRQQTLAPEPVDFDRIASGMEDMVRRSVGPGIQIELKLANRGGLAMCDPSQLESALLNLCVNARDAMPDGGWLVITTEELVLSETDVPSHEDVSPGRYVAIAVTDTGTGMTPEVAAHVFEPFFTTKPLGQGTGLGLSQIYGFVRQSGGVVQIETAPGKGTTVRLCLPFHELDPENGTDALAHNGRTVLLVEDQQDVREMTAEQLREVGYRVLEAENGAAALRLVQAGTRLDLLVSDIGLPGGMNGRQVAETARERYPGLPVILITGYALGLEISGMDVVRKPFDPEALMKLVQTKVEAASSIRKPPKA